jgi:hypothetical protein
MTIFTNNITFTDTSPNKPVSSLGKDLISSTTESNIRNLIGLSAITNRNRLINGGMAIDQRNGGSAQTITAGAALAYTVDRWYGHAVGANVTGQQVQGVTAGQFHYQFTGASGCTSIGFAQRIEQLNCADLAGSTATLSVDLANSLLNTVTWTVFYANTANTFGTLASPTKTQIATGTFTVNNTVTRYSTQIPIPIEAVTGIEVVFTVGAQTSGTWEIGNVQLEPGNVATPFEVQNFSIESLLCFRYFENNLPMGARNAQVNGSNTLAGSVASLSFLAEKRTEPTITAVLLEGTSFVVFNVTPTTKSIIATANAGVNGNWIARLTVSAEL